MFKKIFALVFIFSTVHAQMAPTYLAANRAEDSFNWNLYNQMKQQLNLNKKKPEEVLKLIRSSSALLTDQVRNSGGQVRSSVSPGKSWLSEVTTAPLIPNSNIRVTFQTQYKELNGRPAFQISALTNDSKVQEEAIIYLDTKSETSAEANLKTVIQNLSKKMAAAIGTHVAKNKKSHSSSFASVLTNFFVTEAFASQEVHLIEKIVVTLCASAMLGILIGLGFSFEGGLLSAILYPVVLILIGIPAIAVGLFFLGLIVMGVYFTWTGSYQEDSLESRLLLIKLDEVVRQVQAQQDAI